MAVPLVCQIDDLIKDAVDLADRINEIRNVKLKEHTPKAPITLWRELDDAYLELDPVIRRLERVKEAI